MKIQNFYLKNAIGFQSKQVNIFQYETNVNIKFKTL